ncbi:MAG: DUF2147 domain-containing protein, partial [Pseudomonadota bacterium]
MKSLITSATALCLMATWANADPAKGVWQTEPGETGGYALVEIDFCGNRLCGTITEVKGGSGATDIVGRQMISDMGSAGGNKYAGGTIWAPDQDKTYN